VSDDAFRLPSISFARTLANAGGQVFVYQFDWASPDPRMGACHCLELPFVFDTLAAWTEAALLKGADIETLQTLSKDMMPRWARFIERGDPGFPRWEGASEPVYHFDAHGRLEPSP
jgi:para-nitrobenzyl esterase